MRIVAGKYRGRTLLAPDVLTTRPTADRVRESVFNIVDSRLRRAGVSWESVRVADVFAGSGAMGLEAVSRGARFVVFMENNAAAAACLKKNAQFALDAGAVLHFEGDVFSSFTIDAPCDIIFSDAPYKRNLTERALTALIEKGFIGAQTLCVVEREKDEKLTYPACFALSDSRTYGRAAVDFLQMVEGK